MYRKNKMAKTTIVANESYEGECIEQKIQRLLKNKEPLDGTVPLTYTERKDGVKPEFNIRTDRWEVAAEAMDKVTRSKIAKRDEKAKVIDMKKKEEGQKNDSSNEGKA